MSYEELKGWQGVIGSIAGFVALIIGALFNANLNRRRDDRLRRSDVCSVAAALYGEIVLLRKEAAILARVVARVHLNNSVYDESVIKFDSHFLEAHKLSEPMLYKALAAKVGMLSSDLVIAITEFHQNFQQARTALPLLVENKERKYSYSPLTVLKPARDAVVKIVPALRKIETMTGITEPAPATLEMGDAETMIDLEEESWNSS